MIMRDMPASERPREKMANCGSEALSNGELLAILIRTGTKEKTAVRLADDLLAMDRDGIIYLAECSLEELSAVKGIGPAKACQIKAAVELGRRIATVPRREREKVASTEDVVSIYMEKMRYYKKEFFNTLLLSAKGEIISEENIAIGDLCSSIVHPRESFTSAVKKSAAAVIFIHNHPSGDPAPSSEDVEVTKRLCEAGEILGIRVLDHIIIGDGRYTSFKAKGLI
ncbi:MAG: DNA repair protein RadC [Eubacteriaceae bacterium]|nr:DNA repair protein RadC [Eubacteriaceae bacterium]